MPTRQCTSPCPDGVRSRQDRARARAARGAASAGSVAGGNHFVEMPGRPATPGGGLRRAGPIAARSRGTGAQTANHFFYEGGAKARGLREEPPRGVVASRPTNRWRSARKYSAAHHSTSAANLLAPVPPGQHITVVEAARSRRRHRRRGASAPTSRVYYEISHNLVQGRRPSSCRIGTTKTRDSSIVAREATRATIAGGGTPIWRGTRWGRNPAHPCPHPRLDVRGSSHPATPAGPASYKSACHTVNHGSGRLLARGRGMPSAS